MSGIGKGMGEVSRVVILGSEDGEGADVMVGLEGIGLGVGLVILGSEDVVGVCVVEKIL